MRLFPRSKLSTLAVSLTIAILLSSLMVFGTFISRSSASGTSTSNPVLLKLSSLGTATLSTRSASTNATSSTNETRPVDVVDQDPRIAISGPTSPLPPPPANTPPPDPRSKQVTTNNPGFHGFNGVSHADQRNAGTGVYTNTQFSLEPPDQGLCVNGKFVLDAVNTALAVRSPNGTVLAGPTPINQFFGLKPEVVRSTPPVFGDFTSDPKCYFDPATQHWFLTVLQIDVNPASGAFSGRTHELIAVSQTADPTKGWGFFSIDSTNDGLNGTPKHANCPCLGDQPLIGADANGFFVSTNEFPLFTNGFNGAQLYSISKQALEAAAEGKTTLFPAVVLIDASQQLVPFGGLSFSIQPATQPPGSNQGRGNNGTEFFLSSLDFTSTVDNRIAVWALTNTRSLDRSVPDLHLSLKVIRSQLYGQPVNVVQKDGPRPFGVGQPAGKLNSNDDRMNQVVFANGLLWSGVNTIVQHPGQAPRTGIAFFAVQPSFDDGHLRASLEQSGYIAVDGNSVLFPSIGVNREGNGVASFTLAGPGFFPSAAYMPISQDHTGNVHIAQAGASPEDGFTCYGGPGVCRWGDYSAAVAAPDGSIWLATEYIPNTPRTVLANWGTFVSRVATEHGDD